MGIERVGVVGAGLMGSGIAEVCARGGADVIVCETDAKTAAAGLRAHRAIARTRGARRTSWTPPGVTRCSTGSRSPPTSATSATVS